MNWQPSLGAWLQDGGACFRVWAPRAQTVDVKLIPGSGQPSLLSLQPENDGFFSAQAPGIQPGFRYLYRLDGQNSFPDVASRYQPEGVHGPSEVVDAASFRWSDESWRGAELRDLVIYELHVGAFSPEGTFEGARDRLPALRELGVSAIELMPLADFPGRHNWGYDGVSLFAPSRSYGRPDDLRRLIDVAHSAGIAVVLDVVYNHLGPDGNYLGPFSPFYFTDRHKTPWGAALNFDGPNSRMVRDYFIENALYWLHEFHFDGLRLDATHAILDDGEHHFLAELSDRVQQSFADEQRRPVLIAEDARNLSRIVTPVREGGWGMDAVWADDFHHHIRRALAGDSDGYFQDYGGTAEEISATLHKGWFYCGQKSEFHGHPRGTDPAGIAPERFVICIQNHDQVGNRAFGDRLHHTIDLAAYRAASTLLLCAPQTPMLFMGQEWAASSPFQFFTDHNRELGKLVTEGRRREFKRFSAFSDPQTREKIPDPQNASTFLNSQLHWDERDTPPYLHTLRLYQALLQFRRSEPALRSRENVDIQAYGESALLMRRPSPTDGKRVAAQGDLLLVVQLAGPGTVSLAGIPLATVADSFAWHPLLSTEDPAYAPDSQPMAIEGEQSAMRIQFKRPGAVLFKAAITADKEGNSR